MRDRIKDLRIDSDLTQKQVAHALNIAPVKYSYIERGIQEPSKELLAALAAFYKTSVDYLLGLTDEKKPYPKRRERNP